MQILIGNIIRHLSGGGTSLVPTSQVRRFRLVSGTRSTETFQIFKWIAVQIFVFQRKAVPKILEVLLLRTLLKVLGDQLMLLMSVVLVDQMIGLVQVLSIILQTLDMRRSLLGGSHLILPPRQKPSIPKQCIFGSTCTNSFSGSETNAT